MGYTFGSITSNYVPLLELFKKIFVERSIEGGEGWLVVGGGWKGQRGYEGKWGATLDDIYAKIEMQLVHDK